MGIGEVVIISGPTDAGKTTLAGMLAQAFTPYFNLEGKRQFNKTLQTSVDPSHVKFATRHVGPNGHESYTSGPVRPATHDDLRLVDRVLADRGL